jgi:hypothetical protein
MSMGRIIALVDDDVFWPTTAVLPFLLAGLEQDPMSEQSKESRGVSRN